MPAKNAIKEYRADSYYHIYNRGVAKSNIFQDESDFKSFLYCLKVYLSPKDINNLRNQLEEVENWKDKDMIIALIGLNNYASEISLLAYCLLPNHFHLLVKQKSFDAIQSFMRSLGTKYSLYFNKKYERQGTLFQGRYKAVLIKSEEQLLHLSRYIHLNPKEKSLVWKYSSLPNYLGQINQIWVKPQGILSYFSKDKLNSTYLSFINQKGEDFTLLNNLKLD